uniref:Uncharacterized protein n=1 Tax=Anguilla anguilla TaxID=7936 RepID=A0A0E9W0Q6_ANGAN
MVTLLVASRSGSVTDK